MDTLEHVTTCREYLGGAERFCPEARTDGTDFCARHATQRAAYIARRGGA